MNIEDIEKKQEMDIETAINIMFVQINFLRDEINKLQINSPYITTISYGRKYNPTYGDDKICKCGDPYYRHFDTYDDMYPCGCKYCNCHEFEEQIIEKKEDE
jgi:hypothetical protein